MINRLVSAVRIHGVFGVLQRVPRFLYGRYRYYVDHTCWDNRWGTDTSPTTENYFAQVDPEHASHAVQYDPIQWRWFRRMMRDVPFDPRGCDFVDLGSGKGRALFFAAQYGFRRVVGVEFSAELHAIAQSNLNAFKKRTGRGTTISLMCVDATQFTFPSTTVFVFMNNPFTGPVFEKVVARLAEHVTTTKREAFLLYKNPTGGPMLDIHPAFRKLSDWGGYGTPLERCAVYRITPSNQA
jgi:SAM-dependent methyltransferase